MKPFCPCCGRDFRSKKAAEQAKLYHEIHADLRASVAADRGEVVDLFCDRVGRHRKDSEAHRAGMT